MQAEVEPPEISSLPKLTDKSPKAKTKVLTLQQQLASDLADLMEKVLLRKKGRLDDLVDLNQATIKFARKSATNPKNSTNPQKSTITAAIAIDSSIDVERNPWPEPSAKN